eukprot:TRINITY_DN1573_c5_g1_i1.p1 TRINITY_DN1573_c5_g1~~TRINITY_DN1573_c5_g1_i1.p1  ORF type:complete len:362 (+),score=67.75 TRINITY_DN1573_c5_g1_i1:39-1088(+)
MAENATANQLLGYSGQTDRVVDGSFEQILFLLTPMVALLDLLDKNKSWPKFVMLFITVFSLTEEGNRLGALLPQHILGGVPLLRRSLLVIAWTSIIRWCWNGSSQRSCPLWTGFLLLLAWVSVSSLLPNGKVAPVYEIVDFLSPETCTEIIAAAEIHGEKFGWTTDRHGTGGLSTEDIPLKAIAGLERIPTLLSDRLAPITSKLLGGQLVPRDTFVVRYIASRGNGTGGYLRPHTDGGTHTYSVVLSSLNEYDAGGVRIALLPKDEAEEAADESEDAQNLGRILRLERGNALLQPAKLDHEGMALKRGTRYLLISFNNIHYDGLISAFLGIFDFHGRLATKAEMELVTD